jgi:O-antigen/teichoic acid export membrane protein
MKIVNLFVGAKRNYINKIHQFIFSEGIKDGLFILLPNIIGVITGFGSSVIVARLLGPHYLGQYTLVTSITTTAISLSEIGVNQTAIRYAAISEAANDKKGLYEVLKWGLRWRLSISFAITAILFAISPLIASFWHESNLTNYIRISIFSSLFVAIGSIPVVYWQATRQFKINAFVGIAQRIVPFMGLLALYVFNFVSLLNLICITFLSSIVCSFIALSAMNYRKLLESAGIFAKNWIEIVRVFFLGNASEYGNNELKMMSANSFLKFNALAGLSVLITMQMDVWLMGFFLNSNEVGAYSVASRFTLPLTIVLAAINTALWPRASALIEHHHIMEMLKKTFKYSIFAFIFSSFYAAFAPKLAPFIFGREYAGSIFIGQLLCFRYCLALLITPLGIISYSFGYVRVAWILNLIQLIMVFVLNYFFLEKIGGLASAIALIANEIIGMIFFIFYILAKNKIYRINNTQHSPNYK